MTYCQGANAQMLDKLRANVNCMNGLDFAIDSIPGTRYFFRHFLPVGLLPVGLAVRPRRGYFFRKISMEIDGYLAEIQYDQNIQMWRGEFLGPEGGADFFARDFGDLQKEGEISLKVFKEMCLEDGLNAGVAEKRASYSQSAMNPEEDPHGPQV